MYALRGGKVWSTLCGRHFISFALHQFSHRQKPLKFDKICTPHLFQAVGEQVTAKIGLPFDARGTKELRQDFVCGRVFPPHL